jgi:hypothetical protein
MKGMEIKDNGDRLDAIVMELGHVSGVLQMLMNLNQSRLGKNGTGGNALKDVAAQDTEGLDWVLGDALDRVRRAKGHATEIACMPQTSS